MNTQLRSSTFSATVNFLQKAAMILLALLPLPASAVFIDFNDLHPVYDEEWPCWCDNDLTDQYLDKGLIVHGSWFNGADGENSMTTSNWGALEFIGNFPTFVSMNVSSVYGDAIFFDVYGLSGFLLSTHTAGAIGQEGTPAIPNELVSITAKEGIRFISIQGAYGMRMGAEIDNLTYTYAPVPEPASTVLIALGLGLLICRRKIFHS